jgi:hypothetical protein
MGGVKKETPSNGQVQLEKSMLPPCRNLHSELFLRLKLTFIRVTPCLMSNSKSVLSQDAECSQMFPGPTIQQLSQINVQFHEKADLNSKILVEEETCL